MRRGRFIRSGLAVTAAASILGLVPFATTAAATAPKSASLSTHAAAEDGIPPAARFASCLISKQPGDLILLMDESTSINTSDPGDARLTAANYMLSALSDYAKQNAATINVTIAGFGSDYFERQGWTTLDDSTLANLQNTVNNEKNQVNDVNGFETDYYMALDGARQKLAQQASASDGTPRCQAIAWFTDGRLAIFPRDDDAERDQLGTTKPYSDLDITRQAGPEGLTDVAQAATAGICREGGLADQLRSSGVITFSIGLQSADAPATDFDLLKSITDGVSSQSLDDAKLCGAKLPTDPIPGQFLLASDIDGLINAFDQVPPPDVHHDDQICQTTLCPQFPHQFVLDDSIESVRVLGSADFDGVDVYLTPPGLPPLKLDRTQDKDTTVQAGSIPVTYRWLSPRTVTISAQRPGDLQNWAGLWSVTFVDPTGVSANQPGSHTNIHIAAGLLPAVVAPSPLTLTAGTTNNVTFGLSKSDGSSVPGTSIAGTIVYSAQLVTRTGDVLPLADRLTKEQLANPIAVDLGQVKVGGPGQLILTLELTTAGINLPDGTAVPGTPLTPRTIRVPVTIGSPPPLPDAVPGPSTEYPVVAAGLNFGAFEGQGPVSAALAVTGPGCVWIEGAGDLKVPGNPTNGPVTVTSTANSADSCWSPGASETTEMPFTLTTESTGTGTINGTIQVQISPVGNAGAAQSVPVRLTAEISKPLNTTNFLSAFIAALILGPGIPLLLLYLAMWATAQIPKRALAALTAAVTVSNGTVLRGNQHFALQQGELTDLINPAEAGRRRLQISEMTLKTKIGLVPTRPGYVQVTSGDMVGAGSTEPESVGKRLFARLPLAVHNHWAVLHDMNGREDEATVLLIVTGNSSDEIRADVVNDMLARLPGVLAELRERARNSGLGGAPDVSAPAGDSGFGGGPVPMPSGFGESNPDHSGPSGFGGFPSGDDPNPGYDNAGGFGWPPTDNGAAGGSGWPPTDNGATGGSGWPPKDNGATGGSGWPPTDNGGAGGSGTGTDVGERARDSDEGDRTAHDPWPRG